MKERELNSTFKHHDMGTLKVVESAMQNDCNGCVFQSMTAPCCKNHPDKIQTGECSFERRQDGRDVIFVKVEEQPSCNDGRDNVIRRAKEDLLNRTNIQSSHAEMAVLNDFLERCYQMGWLSQYDPICKISKDDNEPLYHY